MSDPVDHIETCDCPACLRVIAAALPDDAFDAAMADAMASIVEGRRGGPIRRVAANDESAAPAEGDAP